MEEITKMFDLKKARERAKKEKLACLSGHGNTDDIKYYVAVEFALKIAYEYTEGKYKWHDYEDEKPKPFETVIFEDEDGANGACRGEKLEEYYTVAWRRIKPYEGREANGNYI